MALILCFGPQEPNKRPISLEENEEVSMKEYSDHQMMEKSILKDTNLLQATADAQDIW